MVSCSRGKREQREKAVAVEASSREGRLIDFQIFSIYTYPPVLSVNKRYLQRISLCCVITGPRITSGSRYYIGGSAGNRPADVPAPPTTQRHQVETRFDPTIPASSSNAFRRIQLAQTYSYSIATVAEAGPEHRAIRDTRSIQGSKETAIFKWKS